MATNPQEWKTLKSKIKNKFSKLSDQDIESLGESMDNLQDKLQHVYSYSKSKAAEEVQSFKNSIKK